MPTALVLPKRPAATTGVDTLLFDQTIEDILESQRQGDGGTALRKFRKAVPDIASSVQVCSKALPVLASLLPAELTRDSQRLTKAFLTCFPTGNANRKFALQAAALYCYQRRECQRALHWLDCLDEERGNSTANPTAHSKFGFSRGFDYYYDFTMLLDTDMDLFQDMSDRVGLHGTACLSRSHGRQTFLYGEACDRDRG